MPSISRSGRPDCELSMSASAPCTRVWRKAALTRVMREDAVLTVRLAAMPESRVSVMTWAFRLVPAAARSASMTEYSTLNRVPETADASPASNEAGRR